MRRLTLAFVAAAIASAVTLLGQGRGTVDQTRANVPQSITRITVEDVKGMPVNDALVQLFAGGQAVAQGTFTNGAYQFDPAKTAGKIVGKPMLDAHVQVCKVSPRITVNLTPAPENLPVRKKCDDPNCDCRDYKGAGYWGEAFKVRTFEVGTTPIYKNKWVLIGGGAAGATAAGVLLTGGDSTGMYDGNGNGNGNGNDIVFTDYNGAYSGSLGKQSDTGCNFSSTAPVTGTMNLNSAGTGTWIKIHTAAGQTFNFNVNAEKQVAGILYSGSITNRAIGADMFNITDSGSIVKSGTTYTNTITQVFTRINSPSCVVTYKGTMTK